MKEHDIIKERYQLLLPLGSGGFGEVWLAKDPMTGTDCALKFYVRLDDKGREEFSSEYRRMLGIHHPNLLTASYYDEWEDRPFLVMDYCGGGAASGKIGQMDETELWRLIRDVASGLVCLHSQCDAQGKEAPVIHQDIKPANFLQKGDGTWLISDFGISSRMRSSMSSQSGREVSSRGTIPYMGPERFGQNQDLVKASDVWALGASIYEMAKGKVPFGEFEGGTQRAGAEIPHLPKERWSSDIDRLVNSCLQKETWDRPSAILVAEYAECKLKGKSLPRLQAMKSKPLEKTIIDSFPNYQFRPVSMIAFAKSNPSKWLIPLVLIPVYGIPFLILGIKAKKYGHALKDVADYVSMSNKIGYRGARRIFVKGRKFGVLNCITNEVVISADFDCLRWESRRILIASFKGKSMLLNLNGCRSKEYDSLSWREKGRTLVAEIGNQQYLIDIYGNELS